MNLVLMKLKKTPSANLCMNTFISGFKSHATFFLLLCACLELLFFFDVDNLYAVLTLLLGWKVLSGLCLTTEKFEKYPVSFLMIFGLSIFHYLLPLPLTLLDGNPVTYNLRVPYLTFSHHLVFAALIAFTYCVYAGLSSGGNVFRRFLKTTAFYEPPTNKVVWITAFLGLISSFYNYFVIGLWAQEAVDRGVFFYVSTTLSQYIWMPLILLFPKFRFPGGGGEVVRRRYVFGYVLFVLVVAVASNWRTVLFSGVFIVVGLFGVGFLLNHYRFKSVLNPRRVFVGLVLAVVVAGPIMDMSQAMVIVRQERYGLSGSDFLKRTLDVFGDKELLSKFKSENDVGGSRLVPAMSYEWNESYLKNSMLNRIVNLKISDNCLFYASEVGYGGDAMRLEFFRQLAGLLPNVFLPVFGVTYDEKLDSAAYSIGDYLYSLAVNRTSELGSFVISSMPGVGMAIFGYWYLVVVFILFIVIFSMFDSLFGRDGERVCFSYLFFVMLMAVLNYFNDRHVFVFEFRYVMRTYAESVLAFLVVFWLARALSGDLKRSVSVR